MPLLSPYQQRQIRSALERQIQGDRDSRHLGFDARHRPVIQGLIKGSVQKYALLRSGEPTKITGEVENPCVYVDARDRYKLPDFVLVHKTGADFAAHDKFKDLDKALEALVRA